MTANKEAIDITRVLIADLNRRLESQLHQPDFKAQEDLTLELFSDHARRLEETSRRILVDYQILKAEVEEKSALR